MFAILDYSRALEYSIIRRYTNIVYYYYYYILFAKYLSESYHYFIFMKSGLLSFCFNNSIPSQGTLLWSTIQDFVCVLIQDQFH